MKRIFLLLIILLPLLCFGQDNGINFMQVVPNDTLVRTGTLDSGIKYYIRHNAKDPERANFHIAYDVGAVQEEENQNGLAHFLEHMAFNGSKHFQGNALIDYLQSIGVRFGENLNAMTGQENTTYMVTNVPVTREGIVDSVLLVLHDWAGFITLDPKDIDEERGVIREEWRQMQSAGMRIYEKQMPVLYNNSIYSKRNVIGNENVLSSFTYDDLKAFYHKWYRPDMQAFIIVGDFDVDVMEAKLKATMSDITAFTEKTPKKEVVIADNEAPLVSVATDPEATGTQIQLMFRHAPVSKQSVNLVGAQKHKIMADLVSVMINERLEDITKKENAPFLQAGASYSAFIKPADIFYVAAASKDGASIPALEAVYTELLRMQRGGFTASELGRAKTNMLSGSESAYNNRNDRRNAEFVGAYIGNFINNTPYPSSEYKLELTKSLLETTTLEEVNALATTFVRDLNSAVLIEAPVSSEVPTEANVLASIEKVKVSNIPVFTEEVTIAPLVDASKIKSGKVKNEQIGQYGSTVWTLSNGVKVIVKPTDLKADQVIMEGMQFGGTSTVANLKNLASISFYPYLADNAGLGAFSQSELNKILTGKIASANASIGEFSASVRGSSTPKDIETMLQLAYLRMVAPRFEQADLNVVLAQWRAILPNYESTPDYIFNRMLTEKTTGNNPRVKFMNPSMAMLDSVSLEGMSRVYKQQFANANGMTFVFTGNIDKKILKPLVEKYLGSLPSAKQVPSYGKNSIENVKGIVKDEFKTPMETPKVTAAVAYSGDITWSLSERLNLEAISHILRERYTKSIREEAGGSYGVWVQMEYDNLLRPEYEMLVLFNTDPSKIAELLPIVYKEVNDMAERGVSEENLKMFKEFTAKKFAENNISNQVWKNYLQDFYRWGYDNYTDYLKSLDGVTLESVKATAAKIFGQKNTVTVVLLPN